MAKITLSDVSNILGNPTSAANTINANNDLIEQALDLLVSRDGESPNQMTADVDLNHNDIINVDNIHADVLVLNGQTVTPTDLATLPPTVMFKTTYDPQGKESDAFAQPVTNLSSTTQEIRDYIDVSGKFEPDKPYVSLKDNLKSVGLRPEWFDTTNQIATSGDAAVPIRAMFAWGLANGVNKYVLTPGTTYHIRSPDPLGTGQQENSTGVVLYNVSADITLDMTGAVVKGHDTIRTNPANPGTMFWFQSSNTAASSHEDQRIHIIRGKLDFSSLTPSTAGVTTIGGISFIGRFNVFLDHVIADGGTTTPSGDNIGVGGGDQAFFFSNTAYVHALNCTVIGLPDLAYYFSNSGTKGALIEGGLITRCQNGVGAKRFSSVIRMLGVHFRECENAVYNPVADGLNDNMGGRIFIDACIFERIQTRPVDINGLAEGSVVQNSWFFDWGRRISDGLENSEVSRLSAVRIRSPRCQVQNNHFVLRDWTLTTTVGKEQVGLIFSVNGFVGADGIAVDCYHSDNYYEGLYQKVRYDTSTLRNIGYNERGVNITTSDTDSGDNIFWIRLVNDSLATYLPDSNRSVLMIEAATNSAGSPNIMVWCNTTPSPAAMNYPSGLAVPASIIITTGITTVPAAAAANFTVSANSGNVTLINKTGGTLLLRVTEISR